MNTKPSNLIIRHEDEAVRERSACGHRFRLLSKGDQDVAAWAHAVVHEQVPFRPSRKYAAGMIALRPDQDGVIRGYEGFDAVQQEFGEWILDHHLPEPGTPTQGVEHGILVREIAIQRGDRNAGPLRDQVGGYALNPDFNQQLCGRGKYALIGALGALLPRLVFLKQLDGSSA